jgi:hypothetical protein
MKKILCIADGFGKGHIWPMWPQFLQQLCDNVSVDNLSQIGAGNEFICNSVIDSCEKKYYDLVLVQWARSCRLDIINNQQNNISKYILNDKIYNTKYSNIRINNRLWWLSSNSQTEYIQTYHKDYISEEQHKLRTINYIKFLELYLKSKKINFLFFNSYSLDFTELSESNLLDWNYWCLNAKQQGMQEYGRTNFLEFISNEPQPHPITHLYYLKDMILPKTNLTISKERFDETKKIFEKEKIWKKNS